MKYKKGQIIIGQVVGIVSYGAFIKFSDEYFGLLHISEMSDKYVSNIRDFVKEGTSIYVKIIEINEEKKQLKLSIKDIDYRNNKITKNKIIETPSGFKTLNKKLNGWIKDYLKNKKINKYY